MTRTYGLGILSGIGVGLVASNGTLLAAYWQGYTVSGTSGFLTWLGLFSLGLGLMLALAPFIYKDTQTIEYPPSQPITPAVNPTARFDTVKVNGTGAGFYHKYRPSTTEEAAWIDAATDFLLWVRQKGTLDSATHVGLSLQNPNDWMEMIGPFEQHGAVMPRQRGVKTQFAPDWDATRLFNSVLAGYVQFSERKPPKVTPYPSSRMTVDSDGVGKARPLEAE